MTKFFRAFLRDETGAAAAEYALILAVVGAGIVTAAVALSGAIGTSMTNAKTAIETKKDV